MTDRTRDHDVESTTQSDAEDAASPDRAESDRDDVDDAGSQDDQEPNLETALESDADETATTFLELEAELGPTASGLEAGTETIRAQVVDAAVVDGGVVPDDYPWEIETAEALALDLEIGSDSVTTYFAWPETGTNERLSRLLSALDIPADSFAELHGKRLLVTVEDGYFVPVVPPTRPRGSPTALPGIYAGLAFNLAFFASLLTDFLFQPWLLVPFLLVNLLVLPAAVAYDGWYLRTQTDWGQGPWFWAVLSALPGLNLLSIPLYLRYRSQARPLEDS
ncbi:hypothetical protein [Halopiger goleimassiliensis]|uniref:hypothetical protein n=1 Tax=Halopiger goleimassiliensis TaxID=1293048 RepID=UPI000677C505|nr:hypothetical protein [Halopiger goleimassiliensis]